MANNLEIKSTSYDIQEKWISEVAPKYFDINDINMLRIGLFGYINEIQSNGLEDTINMMNMVSNEVYPNKAVLPNSIYAYAALGNFSDFNAVPSQVSFTLALRKKDLIEYSEQKSSYKKYEISRYSNLDVNGVNFMIDYDIIIKLKKTKDNDDYTVSAQYNFDIENAISNITNPYIKSKILYLENEEFFFMDLTARQLERNEVSYNVYSNDLVENLKYDINYEGDIAYFNVFYIPPNSSEMIQLTKYYVDSVKPEEDYFCFYQYNSATQFSISFSAHPDYFKPEFNSTLLIEIYTTNGDEGNFIYDGGEVDFSFFIDNNSNSNNQYLSKMRHLAYITSEASQGKSAMSIDEIKFHSIKAFSVRNNIISDNDLDYYFKEITKNSKMTFIKKRDDLIKRIYSAFLLLKNDNNEIIPTNTVNIVVHHNEFDNYNTNTDIYFIKPGRIYHDTVVLERYNSKEELIDVDDYHTLNDEYNLDYIIENEKVGDYYFTCPFLIKVNTNPYFISYYMNSIYENQSILFTYINEDNLNEFIINSINMERNAMITNKYKISFNLTTSLDDKEICLRDDNEIFIKETGNLQVRLYFKKDNKYLGWTKCTLVETEVNDILYKYEAIIETNDFINAKDEIGLTESIYKPDSKYEILREEFYMPSDEVYMEVAVFYNGYENKEKGLYKGNIPDTLDNYCLCSVFQTENEVQFFKDINNIEYSTMTLDKDNEGYMMYKIKAVPMIKYSYLASEDNVKTVITLLNYFRKTLQDTLILLENNFDIDMKFYNTYGVSKYFTVGKDAKEMLGTTAIRYYIGIRLNQDLNEIIKNDIEKFIIDYTENVNTQDTSNYLYISNLIKALENNFEYIRFIDHLFVNNEDNQIQVIENNFNSFENMTNQQIIKYIPEYLNVSRITQYDENGNLEFIPEIYITYL